MNMNVERPPSVVCYLTSVRKFKDSMMHFRHQRRHGHGRMMCVVSVYVGPPRGRSEGWEWSGGAGAGAAKGGKGREGTGLSGGDMPLLMPITMLLMLTMELAMLKNDDDDD